ncbi:nucleoside recognition domain-containing protein [Ectobacillus ponti]|uniref:Nucleoside recognition domain-containing protein n=1 Tax=Ectobacillus ponti TaxID=2961894 RepID=A0AA42BQT8_9BACI|nr:nucleoside recognition domain-containing protein [Ectobacillus ponti]MCP8970615.1 nucleoside recognition domain-containing protein [Ectobacillus ponti]
MLKRGLLAGLKTTWVLGKVIFPITLLVTILKYTPVLPWLTKVIAPLMGWLGLPGDAAIALVFGFFVNLYAAIGVMLSLTLTVKEVFILAVMLSFAHNLLVESTVATRVGIKTSVVLGVRLGLAFASAVVISLFWKGGGDIAKYTLLPAKGVQPHGWLEIAWQGIHTAVFGILQLAMIVLPLMIVMQVLKEVGFLDVFSRWLAPVTRVLGMKENTATTMTAGLIIGLAYGAGVMIQAVKDDGVSKKDLTLAFIFLVACHAVIEDTLIFAPLGIPVLPLLLIRLVTAFVLTMIVAFVWKRLERKEVHDEDQYHTV